MNLIEICVANISIAKHRSTRWIIVQACGTIIDRLLCGDHSNTLAPSSFLVHTKDFASLLVYFKTLHSPRCADSNLLDANTTIFKLGVLLRRAEVTFTALIDNFKPRETISQVGQGFRDVIIKGVVHVIKDRLQKLSFLLGKFTVIGRFNFDLDITESLFYSVHDRANNSIVISHLTVLLNCLLATKFLKKLIGADVTRVGILTRDTKFDLSRCFTEFVHLATYKD